MKVKTFKEIISKNKLSYVAGFLSSVLVGFVLVEIGFRIFNFPYRFLDVTGYTTSIHEINDRLKYYRSLDTNVLLLGDSILGPSALLENVVDRSRDQTLTKFLQEELNPQNIKAVNFGADGLLLPDMATISQEVVKHDFPLTILLINMRMLSDVFNTPAKAFFNSNLALNSTLETTEQAAGDVIFDTLAKSLVSFRRLQQLRSLWFMPNPESVFQRMIEQFSPVKDRDFKEMTLRQKVSQFYQSKTPDNQDYFFVALNKILELYMKNNQSLLIVFSPQNPEFVYGRNIKELLNSKISAISNEVARYQTAKIKFTSYAEAYKRSDIFLDHCHLTPEGNKLFAKDLVKLISESFLYE